jgi:hypothetical protein
MDQYEIRNVDWREYTNWMEVVFARTAPQLVEKAQPNKQIWREELAYNEPYLQNYFTHPAFDQYPIVGVTWEQAMDYCAWRTDRVNELALIRAVLLLLPTLQNLKTCLTTLFVIILFSTLKNICSRVHISHRPENVRKQTLAVRFASGYV